MPVANMPGKIDVRLVPMLASLYLMCHIDRANIGNAKIEGMVEDLGMTGVQYNIVLSICESNILQQRRVASIAEC
jgi:hypothetical protein